jgi:hypothetical protein
VPETPPSDAAAPATGAAVPNTDFVTTEDKPNLETSAPSTVAGADGSAAPTGEAPGTGAEPTGTSNPPAPPPNPDEKTS